MHCSESNRVEIVTTTAVRRVMNFNLHRFNVKIKISVKFYFYSLPVLYVLYVLAIDTTVTTSALNPQQPKCLNPKKKEKKKNCVK